MRRVLLTGGSGLIGEAIAAKITSLGHEVTVLGRTASAGMGLKSIDLTDPASVKSVKDSLGNVDIIIHCAALAHGQKPPNGRSVGEYNSLMLTNLLDAFRSNDTHWVFLSSVSVFGINWNGTPVDIGAAPKPIDDYGRGKLRDEHTLLSKRTRVDIFRLAPVYTAAAMKDVIKRVALPGSSVKLRICPSPYHSFCHLDNVVEKVAESLFCSRGRYISVVADRLPVQQADLLNIVYGTSISVPKSFVLSAAWLLWLWPSRFGNLAASLHKFAADNVFIAGTQRVDE